MAKSRTSVTKLAVDSLTLAEEYQRHVVVSHVKSIAADFNPEFVGTITVAERPDGRFVVIDGQHRIRAMILAGFEHNLVEVRLLRGLTVQEEAALFLGLNHTLKTKSIDAFRARIIMEEGTATEIRDIFASFGFTLRAQKGRRSFSATTAAEEIYNGKLFREPGQYGDLLHQTIGVLTRSYGDDSVSVQAELLKGMAIVLHRFPKITINTLVNNLSREAGGAYGLVAKGRELRSLRRGTAGDSVAEAVVAIYNRGRQQKNHLEWRRVQEAA